MKNILKNYKVIVLLLLVGCCWAKTGSAVEVYRLRMFFGLSLPGGGAISLNEWQKFEREEIATTFEGFNIVDSKGYYKGKPERSKLVTLVLEEQEMAKAKALAKLYATKFQQDSVMIIKTPVVEWDFIKPDTEEGAKEAVTEN